jgi:ribonuclease HI
VDTATLLGLLRRLAHAEPGPTALHLPVGLSSREAIRAIRAAIRALEPRAVPTDVYRTGVANTTATTRVHIDGASRGNPGPAGVGVLFLQPDGTVVERLHRGIGNATNNVAEYSALLMALERARTMGITDLEVYSDSELLVRQVQGRYQVKHPALRPLYAVARERIAGFRHFTIHHVPRELNAEADSLANRGIDEAARTGSDLRLAVDHGEDE